MQPAIVVDALVKRFAERAVLDGLSFHVDRGEIFGLLGHNGAGKTTTVRLLNGVMRRDGGEVRILGLDPMLDGDAVRARAGVLTETPALDERFTARENLRFAARLFDLERALAERRIEELLADVELADRADEPTAGFSKGMKQKLAIARALLNAPEVLFLDEPTSGLDPLASRRLFDRMRALAQAGTAILFTTHRLVEASELCDRVAIVARGKIAAMDTPRALQASVGGARPLQIDVDSGDTARAVSVLAALVGERATGNDGAVVVLATIRDDVPALLKALAAADVRVYGAALRQATLEDAYIALQAPASSDA